MNKPASPFATVRTDVTTLRVNRRRFIYSTALAATALATRLTPADAAPNLKSANDKLDIACIGVGGWRGPQDVLGLAGIYARGDLPQENIVALCDVDKNNLEAMANFLNQFGPKPRLYSDYREMIDKEKTADAFSVTIPDHQHAAATMRVMQAGKNVYCEKPLTRTIWEARQITEAARKYGVITQMGNQGHCEEGNRRLCEIIWSGAIGHVREVFFWTQRPSRVDGGPGWVQGHTRPAGEDPVPPNFDWNLWLGPAASRPFVATWPDDHSVPVYQPHVWRGWWDFGCGSIGDMACHIMDGAYWALKLAYPTSVELVASSPRNDDMPPWASKIKFEFPARGEMPPCTLTWMDNGNTPEKPKEMEAANFDGDGALIIGEKGKIITGIYGDNLRVLPESSMVDYKFPTPTIPRIPKESPHQDFIRACKGGPAPCSNFDISGPFTEVVLLGNLALRTGKKLDFDPVKLTCPSVPEADAFIKPVMRDGWKI